MSTKSGAAGLCLALVILAACDRNLAPFDPAEEPQQPDLSRIFPVGAEGMPVVQNAPTEMPPPPGMAAEPELTAPAGDPIRGMLRVTTELQAAQPAGAVLFLIARGEAPGPPLAVKRIEAPRFPLAFEIGPDDRMIKTRPFAGPLQLSARLDTDGNAMTRAATDLSSAPAPPALPGTTAVELVLAQKG